MTYAPRPSDKRDPRWKAWEREDARAWARSLRVKPKLLPVVRVPGLVHNVRLTVEPWGPNVDLGFAP